ncbi:MAG: hypothetical protein LW700_03105 [Gemmataceae bacterium]|nr:hypothetical protein [Gemmataceae bacterium]
MNLLTTRSLIAVAGRAVLLALLALSGWVSTVHCQEGGSPPADLPLPNQIIPDLPTGNSHPLAEMIDGHVTPVSGCASCGSTPLGGGLGGMPRGASGASLYDPVGCCPGSECGQGRNTCYGCDHDGFLARILCGVYECLACPDPCYEPGWRPIMDIGFFTECARPISQQRIWMTAFQNMTNYTRNSYKMAATAPSYGIGPTPAVGKNGSLFTVAPSVNIYEASLYTEIAAGNVGIILDVPFLLTDFEGGLIKGSGGSGFGNMTTGIKSTIFDCELLQIGWKTVTNLPVGVTTVGLGNGLTSMEIGGLIGVKVSEDTYLQANLTEWIPFGGFMPFPGAMFITRLSLNHKVWQANPKIPVYMNLEYAGYFFQAGSYLPYAVVDSGTSITSVLPLYSSGGSYQQLGPGIRMFMTEKMDAGFAAQFSLNPESGSWGDQQYRVDFRFRY